MCTPIRPRTTALFGLCLFALALAACGAATSLEDDASDAGSAPHAKVTPFALVDAGRDGPKAACSPMKCGGDSGLPCCPPPAIPAPKHTLWPDDLTK